MGAIFSHCGTWRYWLDRQINTDPRHVGPVYLFAGVNPSTADADIDDATVRKWRGFVSRAGGSGFIAINPFAFCATEVKELAKAADPIGPDNDRAIIAAIAQADILVPCWGSLDKLPKTLWPRVAAVRDAMLASRKPLKVFGQTASGDPKHPLMLGYAGGMVEWNVCRPMVEWTPHADGFIFQNVGIFPGLDSWEVWHQVGGEWQALSDVRAVAKSGARPLARCQPAL